MRDPDRGAAVIAENCDFEDVARGEKLPGKDAYKADYHRWREAFPDGLCKVENVIVSQCGEWATVEFRNTGTLRLRVVTFRQPASGRTSATAR